MIGGILGAVTGLIGAGLQAQAQHDQLMFQYAHFNWEKQRAMEQDRFAQAARSDMFGNKTAYDRLLNEWRIDLTPEQRELRDLSTKEQKTQLAEDLPAARKQKRAIQQRAKEARQPFLEASLGYRYDQPKSEAALRSELTTLMATNAAARSKADQATIMRQALRMGKGGKAQEIIEATNAKIGEGNQSRMMEARKQALAERAQGLQLHEAQYGKPMEVWGNLMSQGGDVPPLPKSSTGADLSGMISAQAQAMQAAQERGTRGVSGAFQGLASAAGKSPDLGSIVKALSGIGRKGKDSEDDTYDPTQYGGVSTFGPSSFDDRPSSGWG